MRRILCAVTLLALSAAPGGAQFILGLTFVDTDPGAGITPRLQVLSIPAGTGTASLLPGGPTDAAVFNSQTAIDPVGNRYFFLGTPQGGSVSLYVVNLNNGTFTAAELTGDTFDNSFDIEYGDGLLYALGSEGGNIRLATIDDAGAGMGTMTQLAGNAGAAGFAGGTADFDPTANRFYFRGASDTLVAVDTATGNVAASGSLTDSTSIQGLEADPDSTEVFVLESTGDPTFDLRLQELNATVGATFGDDLGAAGAGLTGGTATTQGKETSNPAANIFYFIATPAFTPPDPPPHTLYAVNTTTLALADSDVLTGVDTDLNEAGVQTNPEGLEFDPDVLPVELQSFDVD